MLSLFFAAKQTGTKETSFFCFLSGVSAANHVYCNQNSIHVPLRIQLLFFVSIIERRLSVNPHPPCRTNGFPKLLLPHSSVHSSA